VPAVVIFWLDPRMSAARRKTDPNQPELPIEGTKPALVHKQPAKKTSKQGLN
jgi:hypothetical protein